MTALHFPIACSEAHILQAHILRLLPCYAIGGVNHAEGATPGSIDLWPTEL